MVLVSMAKLKFSSQSRLKNIEHLFDDIVISQVKEEIRSVEQRTSHSMEVLVRIDDVRSRVEKASEALKEADNWSSLASAMEDVFKYVVQFRLLDKRAGGSLTRRPKGSF